MYDMTAANIQMHVAGVSTKGMCAQSFQGDHRMLTVTPAGCIVYCLPGWIATEHPVVTSV